MITVVALVAFLVIAFAVRYSFPSDKNHEESNDVAVDLKTFADNFPDEEPEPGIEVPEELKIESEDPVAVEEPVAVDEPVVDEPVADEPVADDSSVEDPVAVEEPAAGDEVTEPNELGTDEVKNVQSPELHQLQQIDYNVLADRISEKICKTLYDEILGALTEKVSVPIIASIQQIIDNANNKCIETEHINNITVSPLPITIIETSETSETSDVQTSFAVSDDEHVVIEDDDSDMPWPGSQDTLTVVDDTLKSVNIHDIDDSLDPEERFVSTAKQFNITRKKKDVDSMIETGVLLTLRPKQK